MIYSTNLSALYVSHFALSQKLNQAPFEGIKPAPKEFFQIFSESKMTIQSDRLPFAPIPDAFMLPHPEYRVGHARIA